MASMNTRLNIRKLDGNIVQKHGVAQRRLEDKQPKEKTNTDCLVKEQENKYQTGRKIKTGIQQQNGLVDETNVTLFAKVTIISDWIKKPIDMLGIFGWLASIKQWMLEPVKVKYIFLGYHKSIVGNKLWRLDDVTSKVVLYMYNTSCFRSLYDIM
ncbi:hypothetical protein Tco_0107792 [Tanacetum coccineum]